MQLKLKPITKIENFWKPADNIFWDQEKLEKIITEEKLTENMLCIQNVTFSALNQELNNVVLDCNEFYKNDLEPYIFYVQFNKKYYWAYIKNKMNDNGQKVILTLKIDVLSSNLKLFNDGKFMGETYIERTNNKRNNINIYHSDICNNIQNNLIGFAPITSVELNTDIDLFVDSKINENVEKEINYPDSSGKIVIEKVNISEQGTAFITKENEFIAYSSTFSKTENFINYKGMDFNDIKTLVKEYSNGSKYSDRVWNFEVDKYFSFIVALQPKTPVENQLWYIISQYANSSSWNNSWISAPKYFNDMPSSAIGYTELQLPEDVIKKANELTHYELHINRYLCVGKNFKIPLDPLKLFQSNNKIYITRIVGLKSVKYNFYYDKNRIDLFYSKELTTVNDLLGSEYRDWKNDLELQYSNGLKGWKNTGLDIIQNLTSNLPTAILGGGFRALGLTNTISNLIQLPFNSYKEAMQQKYEGQRILSKGNQSSVTLLREALDEILFNEAREFQFGKIKITRRGDPIENYIYLSELNIINEFNTPFLLLEEPNPDDVLKITNDQKLYGQVINNIFLNEKNILEFKLDALLNNFVYFQGKILPNKNPIDQLQLDELNRVLASGVRIEKEKK